MGLGSRIGHKVAPHVTKAAPKLTSAMVHDALQRAITGVGPLQSARVVAEKHLEAEADADKAVRAIIEQHVRMAGAQGFLTNLGGLSTMAVTLPANVAGLALIQCRMAAAIAHLRGYDLADKRTHNAILSSLLGEEKLLQLIKRHHLPGTPMAIATAPIHDAHLDSLVANEVAAELIGKVAGKRLAITVGRRVPLVGGMVGMGADGFATWQLGRYVDREFLPRRAR